MSQQLNPTVESDSQQAVLVGPFRATRTDGLSCVRQVAAI
jgi:hypothetical protein